MSEQTSKTFSTTSKKVEGEANGVKAQGVTELISWKFDDWEPDHMHWNAPSNLIIYTDATWSFYAKHIANMRRTGGIFDTGVDAKFYLAVTFYDAAENILLVSEYVIGNWNYKQQSSDITKSDIDHAFRAKMGLVKFYMCTRHIHQA